MISLFKYKTYFSRTIRLEALKPTLAELFALKPTLAGLFALKP